MHFLCVLDIKRCLNERVAFGLSPSLEELAQETAANLNTVILARITQSVSRRTQGPHASETSEVPGGSGFCGAWGE